MTYSDNPYPTNAQFEHPNPSPDSPQHLNKVRDEVVNAPAPPQFHGLDSIIKLGFTDDGAFNFGINLGIIHGQAKLGLVNGADAGINLGPLVQAGAGVYAGVDSNGIHGNVGAGAEVVGLVGAHGNVDTRFGNATGADVGAGANVGPIGARAGVGAALGQGGFDAAASGHARVGHLLGAHAGGHLGLNDNSQVAASAGARVGDLGVSTGAGVWSDGDSTVRPDVYVQGRAGAERGTAHLVPPVGYGSYDQYPPTYYPAQAQARPDAPMPPAPPAGLGQTASIESQPLPPAYEAATPDNVARVDRQVRTQLSQEATYHVQHGDTFKSIAARLMPGADGTQIDMEAEKLQALHEGNGYKSLKAGQKICTEDAYALDLQTRQTVAQHFGLPIPNA